MLGECPVARVVGRHCHDGTSTIAGKHVFGNPDRDVLASDRIHCISAREDTCHLMTCLTFTLGLALARIEVSIDGSFLVGCSDHLHILAFRSEHHESHSEHCVGTGCEDGEFESILSCRIIVRHNLELCFCTFASANPVALCLLDRVAPVDGVKSVEESLCIGRDTETPLAHELLLYRVSATFAHAIYHLVVGKHGAEFRTPVDHCLAEVGDAVVHECLLLLYFAHRVPFVGSERQLLGAGGIESFSTLLCKACDELLDRLGALALVAVERLEHLLECPLCPLVVPRFAGAHLTIPVEAETDAVELLTVACDVLVGSDGWMLTCLNSVLLSREAVSIITHWVKHIEAVESLVAAVDVAGNIAERVTNVKSCSRWIREHVEYIVLRTVGIYLNLIGLVLDPLSLPFLFDVFEIIFHCLYIL